MATSAVLFVELPRRLYVYCFGHGNAFLNPEMIDHEFGLRVALNAVDPQKLRSVDTRTFLKDMTMQTRRQVSKDSSMPAFGLDIASDLLRGVTGASRNARLGARVTGHDSLVLDVPVNFGDLAALTRTLERLRKSHAYRRDFDWVDHVKIVADERLHGELDEKLLAALRSGRTAGIQLVAPTLLDFAELKGFSFDTAPDDVRVDPALAHYLATLRRGPAALTLPMLHRHRISMFAVNVAEPVKSWPVYHALTGQIRLRGGEYVLSERTWYAIARPIIASVDQFVRSFQKNSIDLPPAHPKEEERRYNERVAKLRRWTLGDRKPVPPTGAESPIEFCDQMTPKRQLIHVKPYSGSSTLSHLFAQGATSAEVFLFDRAFRDRVRVKLSRSKRFRSRIPRRNPKPRLYEVAFAIIGGEKKRWPLSLPFFSKLNFRNVAQRLQGFGYRVSLNYVARQSATRPAPSATAGARETLR
jgi:uncharacterized protein (TIGR04141 family)